MAAAVLPPDRVGYAARWMYAHMLPKNRRDPFKQRELDGKDGKLAQIGFHGRHLECMAEHYAMVLDVQRLLQLRTGPPRRPRWPC